MPVDENSPAILAVACDIGNVVVPVDDPNAATDRLHGIEEHIVLDVLGLMANFAVEPPCWRGSAQLAALRLTPLRNAIVESFLSAAFSSLRLVVRRRTMSSWPVASAQAISVP